jgi:hypothetical protein
MSSIEIDVERDTEREQIFLSITLIWYSQLLSLPLPYLLLDVTNPFTLTSMIHFTLSPRQGIPSVSLMLLMVNGRDFNTEAALINARQEHSFSLNSEFSASISKAS